MFNAWFNVNQGCLRLPSYLQCCLSASLKETQNYNNCFLQPSARSTNLIYVRAT